MPYSHMAPDHTTASAAGAHSSRGSGIRTPRQWSARRNTWTSVSRTCWFRAEHRKRIRTTNLLERAFGEGCRRTKVIARSRPSSRAWPCSSQGLMPHRRDGGSG